MRKKIAQNSLMGKLGLFNLEIAKIAMHVLKI